MKSVTLAGVHIRILENADTDIKEEFIAGIISISKGKEPKASCSIWKDVFYSLVHGHTAKGIPVFNPTGMNKDELARYNRVQAGKVPSTGLNHPYKDLKFKPITTLEKEYLEELYADCQSRLSDKKRTAEYRRFIRYLAEVMEHCAASGEL